MNWCQSLFQQFSTSLNKRVEKIFDEYYDFLINYSWPGNIRELRNAVQYFMATLDSPVLLESHVPLSSIHLPRD